MDGYVEDPQEGEVYYVAQLIWRCGNETKQYSEVTVNFGPFDVHDIATEWAIGGHHTVEARNGLLAYGYHALPRVYVETDKKSWQNPVDLDRWLSRSAEFCLTGVTPD